jgi:uncharacterized protein YukE
MARARIEDLAALYRTLDTSMLSTDSMISEVDSALNTANEEWQSKGASEFNAAWVEFKTSLAKLCQAFAAGGSDVAYQHNKFAEGAKEADPHPVLSPLTSPR